MLIHDVIKIRMIDLGYLPDYPYHLISDFEMCNAFIDIEHCELISNNSVLDIAFHPIYDSVNSQIVDSLKFEDIVPNVVHNTSDRITENKLFDDYYPLEDSTFESEYNTLVEQIRYQLLLFTNNFITQLPDWVYSYMIGSAISNSSDVIDIEDLYRLSNLPVADTFDSKLYRACLESSENQIHRTGEDRAPTLFGEPMVIKELRTHQTSTVYF